MISVQKQYQYQKYISADNKQTIEKLTHSWFMLGKLGQLQLIPVWLRLIGRGYFFYYIYTYTVKGGLCPLCSIIPCFYCTSCSKQ